MAKIVVISPEDYDKILSKGENPYGITGDLVGKGEGATHFVEDDGHTTVDFGACGWCEMGHYVAHNANALFGECDYCGAV